MKTCFWYICPILFMLLTACSSEEKDSKEIPLFERLPASVTGIDFENRLVPTEDFNMYVFRNFYNGGGVALGDISGNGLPDIFLTGNMVSNRLYLNKGNFQFEDITEQAGLISEGVWTTGVSFVDINGNGLLDIYITKSGPPEGDNRHNELFINNGDLTFTEKAKEYGLDEIGLSTHAVFFDYDGDGDLDMYLLNNSFDPVGGYDNITGQARNIPDPEGGSKLFRNDNGYFTDVTEESGIYSSRIGFGLSASVSDLNRNGLPDLYIANDFFERDYFYINNGDGTFTEVLESKLNTISSSSMGSDIADLSNNGWPDIYVSDMLPATERRKKSKMNYETYEELQESIKNGFHKQITRNTLQLNNGKLLESGIKHTFSEIGRLSQVEATDWSWAVLIADFDHNGYNDIYVTNGIYKDLLDQDYIRYTANPGRIRELIQSDVDDVILTLMESIPSEPVGNVLFSGEGGLGFEDRSEEWGLGEPGFSSGAAWGDLNGDGSLDLVVSDVNGPVRVYRNRAAELHPRRGRLFVELRGESPNTQGVGAQLEVWAGGSYRYREQMLQRGFQSSVAPGLHVGFGEGVMRVDSLRLRWPDGRLTRLGEVELPARLVLEQPQAGPPGPADPPPPVIPGDTALPALTGPVGLNGQDLPWLQDITEQAGIGWSHRENEYVDFTRERLLVHMRSTEGPAVCAGDVNGNGLEDVYLGGARGQAGVLLVQRPQGGFATESPPAIAADHPSEDTACVLFDATGDGNLDLYVASGGNSFSSGSLALADRLYLGDGAGGFTRSEQVLPTRRGLASTSAVAAGDFTGNGHPDLFVGERLRLFAVGVPARGFLLANDGSGGFTEVTGQWAPELEEAGMITDAVWADWDGDGRQDLIIVGEWMSPRIFRNTGERLQEITRELGLSRLSGWWNAVHAADLNGTGRTDLVLGNHGLNSLFRASGEHPVRMWVGDMEGNGMVDQILSMPRGGKDYPVALRHELLEQLPSLREAYPDYASYAGQTVQEIFTREQLERAIELRAEELASVVIWNEAGGARVERLPLRAQLSPVYGLWSGDVSGDGRAEILVAGNLLEVKPVAGPYDASWGALIMRGDDGGLASISPVHSGLQAGGASRGIVSVRDAGGHTLIVIARNNASPLVYRVRGRDDG
ncbi:MAG: VCBS repeat-containing protein [Balneolaceae bacterium]